MTAALEDIHRFLQEGGFLALFLVSTYVNYRLYTTNQEMHDEHGDKMQQLNDKTLAATKDFALQIRTAQEKHASQVYDLYESWGKIIARLDPTDRE